MAKASLTIVEVSLRDGLQNESTVLTVGQRVELAKLLQNAGIHRIEVGAFVRSDKIPQMQGTKQVVEGFSKFAESTTRPSVLVPNERGMQDALSCGVKEVAIFTACSESFAKHNINCSIEESFERFQPVVKLAKQKKIKVRGYLSTCFGCPYEGEVSEAVVVRLTKRLVEMGCYEVSIGDTIGVATPNQVESVFKRLKRSVPVKKLAGHFHDTRGTALANVLAAQRIGVSVFDSSLGGLGGCPYAPGAAGNVSTEDLVYMFQGMGHRTNVNLEKLLKASAFLQALMPTELRSRVAKAGDWSKKAHAQ